LPFLTTSTACSTHTLQVCCTLLPTMGFAWLQATDVGRSATCEHVLARPCHTGWSMTLAGCRPRHDLSVLPSPEDGTSARVPTSPKAIVSHPSTPDHAPFVLPRPAPGCRHPGASSGVDRSPRPGGPVPKDPTG
jgi:hypothetical protein